MSPNPRRDTAGGRVFNDLRNLARRQGRSTDELLVGYLTERFLYRVSTTEAREHFVLKGGLLLGILGARRATRDIDMLATGFAGDEAEILGRIRRIAAVTDDDGVDFDTEQVRSQAIREDEDYTGLRVILPARIAQARLQLRLDVSVGDPVTPGIQLIDYPQQLQPDAGFRLYGYPIETVLAEKLTTAVSLAEANTRDRDWADLWRLTAIHDLSGAAMHKALHRTAAHRGTRLEPLSAVLTTLPMRRQPSYAAWRRKQGVDGAAYPQAFAQVVADVVAFADPLLGPDQPPSRWQAAHRRWI